MAWCHIHLSAVSLLPSLLSLAWALLFLQSTMPVQPLPKEMEAEGDSTTEMNGEEESEDERSGSQSESEEESSGSWQEQNASQLLLSVVEHAVSMQEVLGVVPGICR